MVSSAFLATVGATVGAFLWWIYFYREAEPLNVSGDSWYMRQFAFRDVPVSAPYCWRPLVPMLARYFGFGPVSHACTLVTPLVVYGYAGGGWPGFACALCFVGGSHLFRFNVKNPDYADAVGQLLFISALWAMSVSSPVAWPLMLLAALCREQLSAALGAVCLFWNPWLLLPLVVGSVAAYGLRDECQDNQHPLIEKGRLATVRRWVRAKQEHVLSFAHVVQPLRAAPYAVPFVWERVGDFARLGLVGFIPLWLLAVPASGQSRLIAYGFGLLVPFIAALDPAWLWICTGFCFFWPIDFRLFDETGGEAKFGFAR